MGMMWLMVKVSSSRLNSVIIICSSCFDKCWLCELGVRIVVFIFFFFCGFYRCYVEKWWWRGVVDIFVFCCV